MLENEPLIMDSDNVRTVVGSIAEIFNEARLDLIPHYYSPEFVSHQGGWGIWDWLPGLDGMATHIQLTKAAWPDYTEYPEIVFDKGGVVGVRMTIAGTNTGDVYDTEGRLLFKATGRRFEVKDMMFCRVHDNKLVEQWGLTDHYSMLIQLGLVQPISSDR